MARRRGAVKENVWRSVGAPTGEMVVGRRGQGDVGEVADVGEGGVEALEGTRKARRRARRNSTRKEMPTRMA